VLLRKSKNESVTNIKKITAAIEKEIGEKIFNILYFINIIFNQNQSYEKFWSFNHHVIFS